MVKFGGRIVFSIKKYLTLPLVFSSLKLGVSFNLYIVSIDFTLGITLAQNNMVNSEHAIYYISHNLVSYETKYPYTEKLYLEIIYSMKKLFHYMLIHTMYAIR